MGKKKVSKRLLSLFLSVLMLATSLPFCRSVRFCRR